MGFDYASVLKDNLPAPAKARWQGFPEYNFIGGHNDGDSVPVAALQAAAAKVIAREGKTLATYGLQSGPQGYQPLRTFVAETLQKHCDMKCSSDDVLITGGSLQALDLVNAALVSPGDTVIVEEASYGGAISRLRRLGAKVQKVALDDGGIVMADLAQVLSNLKADGVRAKYIYTIPTVQNPTGTIMSTERRLEMLAIAKEYGVPIFEDDCYADLVMTGPRPPAIYALDEEGLVVYCGSFSKSLAPALRVGYLVAEWPLLSQMISLKTDAGTGALEQMVLAEFAPSHFADHISELTTILTEKRDAIVDALKAEFGTTAEFRVPDGGIFIWVDLPKEIDTSKLASAAFKEGLAINPGAEWSVDGDWGRNKFRLCFGHPSIDTIRSGVAKLAEICHREFGLPARGANVER